MARHSGAADIEKGRTNREAIALRAIPLIRPFGPPSPARGEGATAEATEIWDRSMKDEYDFSAAARGKFYRSDGELIPPVHLDPEVLA
jgi:hypothetical protein